VDLANFLDGDAKKKIGSDFRNISRQGTPSKKSSKKDDLNREKFPLYQKIADQEKYILLLQENIHFHEQRAVKVTTMETLFASSPYQEIKSPSLHVVSPSTIIKRLDLMTDFTG
jgi:hypothetical protein